MNFVDYWSLERVAHTVAGGQPRSLHLEPLETRTMFAGLSGDIDGDGSVEFSDFLILSKNFGAEVETNTLGDIDGNARVEFADFLLLAGNFGRSLGITVPGRVPQESQVALAGSASSSTRSWRMTWSDEFNGPEPNNAACYDASVTPLKMHGPHYWNISTHSNPPSHLGGLNKCNWAVMETTNWMNNGLPSVNAFDAGEVFVQDGQLILRASAQPAPAGGYDCGNPTFDPHATSQTCPFLSGGVWSRPDTTAPFNGFSQKYGRFEVRAKLPVAAGTWPAHWILPSNLAWPNDGEIDIMEAVGYKPTEFGGNYHYGYDLPNGNHVRYSKGMDFDTHNDALNSEYHVYAVEWNSQQIDYYLDGLLYHTVKQGEPIQANVLDSAGNVIGTTMTTVQIPDKDFFWILNTTITNFNATPNHPANPDPANFQTQYHYIDYVRVYEECSPGSAGCETIQNQRDWEWLWGNRDHVGSIGLWNLNPAPGNGATKTTVSTGGGI